MGRRKTTSPHDRRSAERSLPGCKRSGFFGREELPAGGGGELGALARKRITPSRHIPRGGDGRDNGFAFEHRCSCIGGFPPRRRVFQTNMQRQVKNPRHL